MKNIFCWQLEFKYDARGSRFGSVRKFKLMTDRDSGLSRGFAFVEMAEVEAGQAIAALDGRIVDGQTLVGRSSWLREISG
jgi:RNA recognition motif-containing protein